MGAVVHPPSHGQHQQREQDGSVVGVPGHQGVQPRCIAGKAVDDIEDPRVEAATAGLWLVNRRLGLLAALASILMGFARVYAVSRALFRRRWQSGAASGLRCFPSGT